MAFDAGKIEATADLDRRPFVRSLRELRAEGRRFAAEKFTPNVGADTAEGDAKVLAFQRKLTSVGTSTTTAKVSADTTEALLKIQPLTVKLDEIRNRVATARVDASTDDARRKLDALDLQLRRVGLITSRPRVSIVGAESANIQLDAIAAKLAALSVASASPGAPGSSGGGGGGSLLSRLGAGAPGFGALALGAGATTLGPLVGLGLGAGASLLTPFTAATVGIGAFGVAAHSSIKTLQTDMKTLSTLQTRYNAAVTDKDRAAALKAEQEAWRAISPQQRQAITNINTLKTDYADFQSKLAPEIFPAIAGGVKLLGTGLTLLEPVAAATGKAIVGLEKSAEHAFQAPFWKDFFGNFLPGEASRATDTFAKALGNLLDGGAHLVEGFAPLGHDFEGGLVRLTKRFDNWSQGDGPARFVKWVRREAPAIKHDVGEIASGVASVSKALIPLGTDVLNTVGKVAGAIGEFSHDHPGEIKRIGEALLVVGAGLKAIKVAGSITDAVAGIRGLRGGKGITGGGSVGGPGPCCCGPGEGGGGAPVGGTAGGKAPKEPSPIGAGKTFIAGSLAGSYPDAPTGRQLPGGASGAVKLAQQFYSAGATAARAVQLATANYPTQTKALADWRAEVDKSARAQRDGLTKALVGGQSAAGGVAAKIDAYRQKLQDSGAPLDTIIAKTAAYAAKLRGIPSGVHTKVSADTAQAQRDLQTLRQQITSLPDHTVRITTTTRGGSVTSGKAQLAAGGAVSGPGTGTSDSIPAWLSNGEFVVNARATARHRQLLHAINGGGYASGGPVHLPGWYKAGNHPSPNTPSSGSGGSGGSSGSGSSSGGHGGSGSGSAASKGPSHLTIANAIASIVNFSALTFASDLQGTAHQVRSGIGQMIDRLNSAVRNHYLAGDKKLVKALRQARAPLARLADEEAAVTKSLASAQQRLSSLRGNAASVRSGTTSSFLGLGDLTQASNTSTVGGLLSVDDQQVKVARAFHRNLAHLRKMGLSKDEYRALEEQGPAAAGQTVAMLATSSRAQIAHFNRNEATLRRLGASTGKSSADYLYASRIADARGDVADLRHDRKEIIRHEKRTADAVEALLKGGLQDHVTHALLKDVHDSIRRSNDLLATLSGAPKQAHTNHRAHVAGVNR